MQDKLNYASERATKISNIIINCLSSYMHRIMVRPLNKLKSEIVAVDKVFETPPTTKYSNSTHRIKNALMQNMSLLLLYIIHLVACQCSQLQEWQICSAVTFTGINNNIIVTKSTGTGSREGCIDRSMIIHRTMYYTLIRPKASLPAKSL